MFSLLRKKENLSQSSKVSTSCPSINSPGSSLADTDNSPSNIVIQDSTASSDTDGEDIPKASRSQRMFARKSIRRQRKREKDFEKKIKYNKITMDDYLSKQTEFKLWLTEEKHKTVNDIKSPKAKAYFKAFVKLWNKRKLAQKYYRGTISCETPPNPGGKQRCSYLSLADSPFPNTVTFPQTIDLSHEGSILSDSPFSTFGKSPGSSGGINKTPGSGGYDLLDLKRKAIFNNINKETGDSDKQSDNNSDDHILPIRKSGSSSQSSCESTSESISDSPKSSKSSTSKREKDENLYKVTVLSWTSKGELKVQPQNSPDLPEVEESTDINPDILSKHLTSREYTTIEEHNTSIPYKDVHDAVSNIHDPTYCVVDPTPGYAEPYDSHQSQTDVFTADRPGNASSIEDLYAVPIKKKKSDDQSETISLTSNESATHLDRKVSNNVNMEKLSDIISSGSDFSITSGSSMESVNHLTIPGQDGMGKASSAPELSTILEAEVTKHAEKSSDELCNFTNVTAINMTCLNNSYLDGNAAQPNILKEKGMRAHRFPELTSFASSTPDRRRNLSDPSKQNNIGNQMYKGTLNQEAKRTLSDPTTSSPRKVTTIRNMTPRSSLPSPPPPPTKDNSPCSPLISVTQPVVYDIKSPQSDSWPSPPPSLELTPGSYLDSQPTPETWPTPPTTNLCESEPYQLMPSPPVPPDPLVQTPESVFEDQTWPTPPSPQDMVQEKVNSDDAEPPKLITADFISNSRNQPPVLKISDVQNIANQNVLSNLDVNKTVMAQKTLPKDKENIPHETRNTEDIKQNNLSERQMSTTSIERFETDIDAMTDSTCDKENTQTKTRLVLETVV